MFEFLKVPFFIVNTDSDDDNEVTVKEAVAVVVAVVAWKYLSGRSRKETQ